MISFGVFLLFLATFISVARDLNWFARLQKWLVDP